MGCWRVGLHATRCGRVETALTCGKQRERGNRWEDAFEKMLSRLEGEQMEIANT